VRLPPIPTIFRIGALTMLLVLCSNIALLGLIHASTYNDRLSPLHRHVDADARALSDIYASGGEPRLAAAIGDMLAADSSELTIGLYDRDGRQRAGNLLPPSKLQSDRSPGFQIASVTLRNGRRGEAGLVVTPLKNGTWLLTGRLFNEPLALQRTIQRALMISLGLSLLFGVVCALILAHFVRQRVRAIARAVDDFGHRDLALRAPTEGSGDVFDKLAGRINAMLDRIATLMTELRTLTDSLAHDLRSPVGRLRVKVEQALTVDDPAERDAALQGVMTEADTLTHMLTTVLEIGRYEALASREQFGWADPGDLIDEIADLYGPVIDEAGLRFEIVRRGPLLPVFAHRQLLAQAVSNLIENAMNHGAAGGAIELFAEQRGESQHIGVADRGPGIATDQVDLALSRFGRLDASRSRPGAGLGLTLVQAIAHLHDGALELRDNGPGLRAALKLPVKGVRALDRSSQGA
jgi:signal transduction histidine kinase